MSKYDVDSLIRLVGKRVRVTSTRRLGFKCINQTGIVRDTDRTGYHGWIRVALDNGISESFRFHEVTLEEVRRVVTKSGLRIRIRK